MVRTSKNGSTSGIEKNNNCFQMFPSLISPFTGCLFIFIPPPFSYEGHYTLVYAGKKEK